MTVLITATAPASPSVRPRCSQEMMPENPSRGRAGLPRPDAGSPAGRPGPREGFPLSRSPLLTLELAPAHCPRRKSHFLCILLSLDPSGLLSGRRCYCPAPCEEKGVQPTCPALLPPSPVKRSPASVFTLAILNYFFCGWRKKEGEEEEVDEVLLVFSFSFSFFSCN